MFDELDTPYETGRLLFDLGGAVRALSRLFPIDDISLSVIEDDCMKVFTQHDWTALGAQYRLEDYPASRRTLETGDLVSCRVDDPEADLRFRQVLASVTLQP